MSFTLLVFSGFWFWLSSILFLFYSLVFLLADFRFFSKLAYLSSNCQNFNIFIFKLPKISTYSSSNFPKIQYIFIFLHIFIFKLVKKSTYASSNCQNLDIFIFRANNLAQRSSALNCGLCSVWEVLRLLFFFFFLIYNFREFFSFLKLQPCLRLKLLTLTCIFLLLSNFREFFFFLKVCSFVLALNC